MSKKPPHENDVTLYRWMRTEEHATQFCKGEVFLSTLGICRNYEDPGRGDKHEGLQHYFSGRAEQGVTEEFDLIAARSSIDVRGSAGTVISNVQSISLLPDAWVLCCTEIENEEIVASFGSFCVRIDRAGRLFRALGASIAFAGYGAGSNQFGRVQYEEHLWSGSAPSPGPLGFVKRSDPYKSQKEVRMLFIPDPLPPILKPITVSCLIARRLCSRIR